MTSVLEKEKIDEIALMDALDDALRQRKGSPDATHPECARILREHYARGQEMLGDWFIQHGKTTQYLKHHAKLTDEIMQAIAFIASRQTGIDMQVHGISLLAVGGYGRMQLFPHSDKDILFIIAREKPENNEFVQLCLYYLWDLKWQIGHAVRTMRECVKLARADHTIAANLLDARFVAGDDVLSKSFLELYERQVRGYNKQSFVQAKLNERRERHVKQGNSRFVLEPNIKENKGALRDLHTLHWIASYCYGPLSFKALEQQGVISAKERREFNQAERFLSSVRIHLHLIAGREEERLTFEMQKMIGERLGYRTAHAHRPVERFMKRYFQTAKTIGDLTRIICAILEEENVHKPGISLFSFLKQGGTMEGFDLDGKRLRFPETLDIRVQPSEMMRIFLVAQNHDLDIHPRSIQDIQRNLEAIDQEVRESAEMSQIFLDILLHKVNPEITLRRLNEAGVLGQFIPDFKRVVGQMQYDMYHVYTVDEHTIRAIGFLHRIEEGEYESPMPLSTEVCKQITARRALYLALLCHDIAKGRGGNHEKKGGRIAYKLALRLGMDESEAELAAWLVKYHILFTEIAFKRDLDDPQTIQDFVNIVQSPERLRVLLAISVADIRAVGPAIWNGWKGSLLRGLFQRAEAAMGVARAQNLEEEREQFRHSLQGATDVWDEASIERYLSLTPPDLWYSEASQTHLAIADLLQQVESAKQVIACRYSTDEFMAITNITMCIPGHSHLLSCVSGAIAMIGASIQGAKIYPLSNGLNIVMVTIQTLDGEAFTEEKKFAQFEKNVLDVINGKIAVDADISPHIPRHFKQGRPMDVLPTVFIDNALSQHHTVIEVNGPDRLGFLHDIAQILSDLKLSVSTAHVTTYGEKAIDVFYVKNQYGFKIQEYEQITYIKQQILSKLSDMLEMNERAS
ncbi:MAG: [protein-PII] uridylyltransferase [Rickettsiales bacterium]|nr:[protein-PII] uridylyltransferase [Rickettsiales bacterium]